jgi:hypothetical protein
MAKKEPYPELSKMQRLVKKHPEWSNKKILEKVYKKKLSWGERYAKGVTLNNIRKINEE